MRIITLSGVILVILNFYLFTNIYPQEDDNTTTESTLYFEIEIPDDWTYDKYSDSYATKLLGFGPANTIDAMPSEYFGSNTTYAAASFKQYPYYTIKNAPLDTYVKSMINGFIPNLIKVISENNVTVANETSRQIYAEGKGKFEGFKFLEYYLFHNKEPYMIAYKASNHLYEKYLPDFEKMLNSFKWID